MKNWREDNMSVGLYCNWGVKVESDGFYISSVDAKYLYNFKKKYDVITLLSSTTTERNENQDVFISSNEISLIPLPVFSSYLGSIRFFVSILMGVRKLLSASKNIYVRTPEPFGWLFSVLKNKKYHLINYHFTSNPIEVIKNKEGMSEIKKKAMLALFYPEYLANCFSAYMCKCTVNGPSVVVNIPQFLRGKAEVLIETTLDLDDGLIDISNKFDGNVVNFICVSRFVPAKGLQLLIDAFASFKARNPSKKFQLILAGNGPLFGLIKDKVNSLDLDEQVIFLGYLKNGDELNNRYREADVFINPSLSETGPRVLLEAMSNALFCISTDVGYVRHVMSDNNDTYGLIINKNSVSELVGAIDFVFNNISYCRGVAIKGPIVSSKYTLERFVESVFL
ncbi:glycosyltransferase family 4 protein [Pectobacterium brasiliense]|uniref:glycosyltransferase family 4 protein n=1 Tax=Pectobacterium brasiliense TaxID=180957 RepID=UPI0009B9105A|nr:glycosyltransferase family 4 protein [Pectobacterium brasiliense]